MSKPRIPVPTDVPGIRGLMAFRPETAKPMLMLAQALLRDPLPGSTLTRGERELIATVVSARNDCVFCATSHGAFAAAQIEDGARVVEAARRDPKSAPLSDKVKALVAVAEQVQESGRAVTDEAVAAARAAGATDSDVHDAVLIAAAFCMFNRYVDGLRAITPTDPAAYEAMVERILRGGYYGGSSISAS